jgi:hypothetical protein
MSDALTTLDVAWVGRFTTESPFPRRVNSRRVAASILSKSQSHRETVQENCTQNILGIFSSRAAGEEAVQGLLATRIQFYVLSPASKR